MEIVLELKDILTGQRSWRLYKSLLHDPRIMGELEMNLFFKENNRENIAPSALAAKRIKHI